MAEENTFEPEPSKGFRKTLKKIFGIKKRPSSGLAGQKPAIIQQQVEEILTRDEQEQKDKQSRQKAEEWLDGTAFPSLIRQLSIEATSQGRYMKATRFGWEGAPAPYAYISIIFDRKNVQLRERSHIERAEKETQIFCYENGIIRLSNHTDEDIILTPNDWKENPLVQERGLRDTMDKAKSIIIVNPKD